MGSRTNKTEDGMKHKLVAWLVCLTLILSFLPDQARAEGEDGDWQLVGQTGGTTKALLAEGTTLYVGSGLHVLIVDVSTPGQLRVIGTSPLLPDFVEGIASDGAGKLFVSCGLGGLVALDVKNPAKPSQLGVLDTRGYTESVTLDGKYALVADGPQGLQIVDVSDPAKMKTVSEAYPLAYAYDVAIADKTAYLAGGGSGVFTVDLSDPLHPKEAGLTPLDGFTYDLELLDGKLYAACAWGGVTALTLDDTLAPKRVANAQTSGWAMALTAFGKDLLVLDGADGAMIYSAASTALVRLSSYTLGGFALAGAVSGTTAFVLDREKGLLMLDLSKKSDPTLVGRWMPLLEGRRLTLQDGVCYVAGGASGLKVFDLSDASNPAETFWYDCGSSGYVFKTLLHDEKAYVAVNNSTGPFMIFDASDPLHPAVMGYLRWGLDVPVAPDRSLTLGTDGFVYAAAEHHDYSIDVRNPLSPEVASSVESNGTGNADCSGDLLVTFGGQGIRMIDVSDPANLKLVSTLPLSETSGEAIRFINPETIIAAAYSGVWIVDVSDPANPKKISEIKNLGSVMDIFIDGANAYLSTLGNGIQVVALSDLTKPKLEETIMTPGLAYDCSVEGNLLIVADSYAGICVYQRGQALAESAGDEGSALFKLTFTQNLEVFEIREPDQSASPKETYDVVVTSAADAGPGSLREAILALKSGTTITFDPAIFPIDQPKMIRLDSALPAIGENYTTLDASNAGVILDGSNLTTGRGIYIKGSHCTVMGLQIYNFPEMGIEVEADYARIGGSREIGTGPVGQGNVISGNGMHGVFVSGFPGWHCAVSGNLIGTDVTGTKAVPNFFGVFVGADSYETVIGGTKPGEGNVISGNANINCDSFGQYTHIVGNLIGVDITGTKAVNTDTSGSVKFECGATGIIVGGTTPAERNIISGAQMGVIFSDGDSHSCSAHR